MLLFFVVVFFISPLVNNSSIFTHLDDFFHTRGADHVCVRVEADLVDDGAVALEDHERAVHHAASCQAKRSQQKTWLSCEGAGGRKITSPVSGSFGIFHM